MAEQSQHLLALAETRYQALEQSSEHHWRAQGEAVVSRLEEYARRLTNLEEQRQRESAVLGEAVAVLRRSNEELRAETRGLAGALTDRTVRGTWGEVQLRRVLEQAGMVAHADFVEQSSHRGPDAAGRPDVVVRLPNGRCVVIDAKAPLDAYLRASACDDDAGRSAELAEHARAVAGHVSALSRRDYQQLVPGSIDFVVMFVPGDAFLSAAFDHRPDLFDLAAGQDVILASPGTLMAFLRGVASGWRERQVAEEAEAVAALGRELHERVSVFAEHFGTVGVALGRAVGSYNQALSSMERRLLVTARRFEDHGAGSRRALPSPEPLVDLPLLMSAPELLEPPPEESEVA
jgi:DNA recombination protein RmuC